MKFKGTIIITDPCYIIKKYSTPNNIPYPNIGEYFSYNKNEEYPDYKNGHSKILSKELDKWQQAIHKYYTEVSKYDDWEKCDYGDNMSILGINTYISESTIYGDWSCTTYTSKNPKEDIDYISDYYKNNDDGEGPAALLGECEILGSFCADSGMVGVFLLDEVLNYNPDFKTWIDEHPWCVTTIPDFDGDIEYYVDKNDEAHIIGTGNINFITLQTGA